MSIDFTGTKQEITKQICEYMSDNGLVFSKNNLQTSKSHAILMSGSSIHYYPRKSKWGEKGIVLYCTDKDYQKLSKIEGTKCFPNADAARPHSVFLPNDKLDECILALKGNSINTKRIVIKRKKKRKSRSIWSEIESYNKPSRKRKKKWSILGLLKYITKDFFNDLGKKNKRKFK